MTTAPQVKVPQNIDALMVWLQSILDKKFEKPVWLRGTVQYHRPRNGFDDFLLSKGGKSIRCIADQPVSDQVKNLLKNGTEIDLAGKLKLYPQDSRFEVVVEQIYPAGQEASAQPVAKFNADLKAWLEQGTQGKAFRLRGAVSNCKGNSKYTTFEMFDLTANLRGIIWEPEYTQYQEAIVDKAEINAAGTLEIYEGQCWLQLHVQGVQLLAANSGLNYPEAIEQLRQKGLWPKRPKHRLPEVIKKIGLITSQGSMALADFRTTYDREGGEAVIEEAFAPVQGQDAPAKIAANINRFSQSHNVDIIVITRGGGNANELSKVFDNYLIAEAICQSTVPVLTAIGHTENRTLADFIADADEITPTGAAVSLAKIPAQQKRSGGILNTLGQLLR